MKRQARITAIASLLGLAACALVVSREAGEDRLAGRILELAVSGASTARNLASTFTAFSIGMGIVIVLALAANAIVRLLEAKKDAGGGKRKRYSPPARRAWIGLIVLALSFAVLPRLAILAYRSIGLTESPAQEAPVLSPGERAMALAGEGGQPEAATEGAGASPFLVILGVGAGAVAMLAFLAAVALPHRLRGAAPAPAIPDRGEEARFAEALGAGRRRLALGDEVRDAIIGCYGAMCEAFTEGGHGGASACLTAREFAALLGKRLAGSGSGGEGSTEIEILTGLFEKARYSDEACSEDDRSEAEACLAAIEGRAAEGRA